MKKLLFWKMSGSGNDFVVLDNRAKGIRGNLSTLASRLCHRQFGIGADGLLLIEPSQEAAFRMAYFNSDGSRATMCGNGARCIAWAAHQKGVVGKKFDFETDAGIVHGDVSGDVVQITLSDAFDYLPEFSLAVAGKTYKASYINTGVPHTVIEVPNVAKVDLPILGRAIRFHKMFQPKGTNVNFIQRTGRDALDVRTYERGVEGETLACGTGVTACAITAALRGRVGSKVHCTVAGGDTLEVAFELHKDDLQQPATRVTLRGPVLRTFQGEVDI